jgi:hypothetical protein
MQSEQLDQLATALSIAQGEIEGAVENSANPYFKSKYADLHTVMQACKKPLKDNGLSVVMTYEVENEKNYLVTRLLHKSGQWIKGRVLLPAGKGDSQSIGGSTTYFRRYSLSSLIGLSTFDDDGESERKATQKEESRHMQRPVEPMNMSLSGSTQPIAIDHSTVRLQKAVCATGNLVGEDDVTKFLEYLVEKYPKKTRAELIASALSTDEKVAQFSSSMKEWKDRPASVA